MFWMALIQHRQQMSLVCGKMRMSAVLPAIRICMYSRDAVSQRRDTLGSCREICCEIEMLARTWLKLSVVVCLSHAMHAQEQACLPLASVWVPVESCVTCDCWHTFAVGSGELSSVQRPVRMTIF